MRGCVIAAALLITACGGDGKTDGDADFDWVDQPDQPDTGSDVPDGDAADTETDPVVSGAGQFRTHLPSEVAPDDGRTNGLALRVSHPASDGARHDEGAPVVVMAPGGHGVGSLGYDEVHPVTEMAGVVVVLGLLQGGGDEYAHLSSGTYDYRGPDSKSAFRDIVRYAMGELADEAGFLITDRIPWADTSLVGLVGMSHGGNLVLTTLADHASALAGVDFFASWESPVGDQYVGVELGGIDDTTLNPYYVPGTCTVTSCPWPGLRTALDWDSGYSRIIEDPLDRTGWPVSGIFYLDADDNGVRGDNEYLIAGLPGPGEVMGSDYLPHLYFSVELADVIDDRVSELFPMGMPEWMATTAEMRDYWAERDGSLVIGDVHAGFADLLVMVLGTVGDHVQGQPDHPHLRSHLQGWIDAGHAWVRMNPDAVYVAEASGEPATGIPEIAAGDGLPYPGTEDDLLPDRFDPLVTTAAVMELADRVRASNTDADLDAVIY